MSSNITFKIMRGDEIIYEHKDLDAYGNKYRIRFNKEDNEFEVQKKEPNRHYKTASLMFFASFQEALDFMVKGIEMTKLSDDELFAMACKLFPK